MTSNYRASDFSKAEENMMNLFRLQRNDAKYYFTTCLKPQYDRAYKLYRADNHDRATELKRLGQTWRSNIFVPYVNSVVETLMPRILDARPEFTVQGRNEDDQLKSTKVQNLSDYTWEVSGMDDVSEMLTRSALIYGTGFLQVSWKKDVRKAKFLKTSDLSKKKYVWEEKEQVFYDAPFTEHVDNYSLWYDWHNIPRQSKQYWFKRLILTEAEIKRKYPFAEKKRLAMAIDGGSGDITDYASIRNEVKKTHEGINKGDDYVSSSGGTDIFKTNNSDFTLFEVYEWWRPFDDEYAVVVGGAEVPILKGGSMPNPYDFKEAPFIEIPYLKLPNEFEGIGLPLLLENPQIMLNLIKNQRLDATTLSIHKMWIVNPLANIDKKQLVTRPFGIIYSPDPNGVREVQFSDIKASAYREEELLKGDMKYASGVDDFSMGTGSGGSSSATEVRHLRESTLERVRLFVNHLGDGYATMLRYWMTMYKQFFTKAMTIRIIGEDGNELFPLIEKDDLMGQNDYKATVIPSIAGKNDIEKKQGMDLFQLLISLPFIDPRKLTSKVLQHWSWSLDSISKPKEEPIQIPGMQGIEGVEQEVSPESEDMIPEEIDNTGLPSGIGSGEVPASIIQQAVAMLGGKEGFKEANMPINLLKTEAIPPTVREGIGKTTNLSGANRKLGGKVNTNINLSGRSSDEGNLLSRAQNIQM
jgi:hypothetical protein